MAAAVRARSAKQQRYFWIIQNENPNTRLGKDGDKPRVYQVGKDFHPGRASAADEEHFKMRVRSWLRMNAGGVLNTCKSNEELPNVFGQRVFPSGGRVSNAWVTCRMQGDNSRKQLLIPHKPAGPHGPAGKDLSAYDGPASD